MAGIPTKGRIFTAIPISNPSGWCWDTDYGNVHLQGSSVAGDTGGVASHSHIADGHTHIQDQHRHGRKVGGGPGGPTINAAIARFGAVAAANSAHLHAQGNTTWATATNQSSSISVSTVAGNFGTPESVYVGIFKPDSDGNEIPDDCFVFAGSDLQDDDWKFCDGNNGTPDIIDRFIIPLQFNPLYGFTFGNATHTHTSTAHAHTQDAHDMADFSEGSSSNFGTMVKSGPTQASQITGHHLFTNLQNTVATNQNETVTINAESNDPAFTYLAPHQNISGSAQPVKKGFIIGWVGTRAEIPLEWTLCNGTHDTLDLTACQIKCTATGGSIGTTGGSNEHTHTTVAHTHIQDAHDHTFTFTSQNPQGVGLSGFGVTIPTAAHSHSTRNIDPQTAVNQDATVTMSSVDKRYPYRTISFIQYRGPPTVRVLGNAHILGKVAIL